MLRDRGTIKWTAMMLPEHVKLLREWKDEELAPIRQQPDEQQYEEWNYRLQEALELTKSLTITYWKSNRPFTQIGLIQRIDTLNGIVRMQTASGELVIIPLETIENISEIE